jgi:hypothetical protein
MRESTTRPLGTDVVMCPSAPPSSDAVLLAITKRDGTLAYLPRTLPVNDEFVADLSEQSDVDQRFRFAAPCVGSRCAHWRDHQCSIPSMLASDPALTAASELPRCSIRRSCRWFSQQGAEACRFCPGVVRTEPH